MTDPTTCPHRDVVAEADLGKQPIPLRITSADGGDMDGLAATVSIGRCPGCGHRVAAIVLHPPGSAAPMFVTLPAVVERDPGSYRHRAGGWSL